MTQRPADYIDLAEFQPEAKKTFRQAVVETCRRLYDQEFTGKDMARVMISDRRWQHLGPTRLYNNVRGELTRLAREGELVIVRKGGPGKPNIYRNPQEGENVISDKDS